VPTQVNGRLPSPSAQATARKLGAQLALDAIDFDEELRPAMAYVFGNTFICKVRRTMSQPSLDCIMMLIRVLCSWCYT